MCVHVCICACVFVSVHVDLALPTLRFQGSKSGAVEAGTVVVKLLNRVGQSPN